MGGAVGDGAVGLVRRATRATDERLFAVKLLAPDPKYVDEAVFDDVAARFKREGERGIRLRHPHLVTIEGYTDNAEGSAFTKQDTINPLLMMEFIRGRTLESYIKNLDDDEQGNFQVTRERLNLAIQLVVATEELHDSRLVHRDIKPANIFLNRPEEPGQIPHAKLGDFGVMKWGDFHASLSTGVLTTLSHKGLGTLKYMSPESALRPRDVTPKSDIYSLGITLFELFSGRILASAHHVFEIMNARLSRGTAQSRFLGMGYRLSSANEAIAELVLDMHLRGISGRPTAAKLRGRLEWEYENRFDRHWSEDLNKPERSQRR